MKKAKIILPIIIGTILVGGCTGDKNADLKAKKEITISAGYNIVAGKFDPTIGYGVWAPDIFHSHILTVGKNNELINDLATESTISPDGLTYTYRIRKDAKFSDGKPLTAKDIVFTFEKTKDQASAADMTMLDKVEAKDDYTVVFSLKKPWSTFPYSLTETGIVPQHAYTAAYGDHPIGSGPWKVLELKKNQQLILVPNEHYYGKKPNFEKVTILRLDEDAALAAAKSGKLDLVYVNGEAAQNTVKGMKILALPTIDSFAINLPTITERTVDGEKVGNNITSDIAIRKALNIGIDRKKIIENSISGKGVPAFGTSPDVPWSSNTRFEDNKVAEAKKILEEAGWKDTDGDGIRDKNGLKAQFTVTGRSNDLDRYNTVVALSQNAKELGIDIVPKSEAWSQARKARAIPTCWAFVDLNPINFYRNYHSSQIGKQTIGNPASYSNTEVDREIELAIASVDNKTAQEHWKKAQKLAEQDVPFLTISSPQLVYFVKEGLNIPDLGKLPVRGQGLSILENMNEWSF